MNKMDRADCPVFRPSRKDMSRSFEKYIESIEQECLPFGICKITAAKGWTPCAQGYIGQDLEWEISRIEQEVTRETMAAGIYTAAMTPMRKQTVRLYKQQTESPTGKRLRPPAQHLDSLDGLESAYWRTIPGNTEYGADNEGTLFDKSIKGWNLACLDSCLSRGLASDPSGQKLKGVNTPYLYYGRWKATFAWHTEDMDLHSVNYLHYGAPKIWYCIPPAERQKMDAFVAKKLYAQHGRCREFMRHKTVLIKPEELQANGITVQKVVQHPGDFIINFPGAYHSGFNVGFNCAESTNFATKAWIQHGAVAQFCRCTPHQEPVRLDMSLFLGEALDDYTRQLIRQRTAKDRAARGEPMDCSSDADADKLSGSDQDSCNLHGKLRKAKPKGKIPQHQQTLITDRAALDKPARAVQQVNRILKATKHKDKPGKADSKQVAVALRLAKRAKLAPSAAAKLPQPRHMVLHRKQISPQLTQAPLPVPASPSSPKSRSQGPASPTKARGRPKGSTKAALAVRNLPSQASTQPQHQSLADQHQQSEQQLHERVQPSSGSAVAHQTGKRKRSCVEEPLRVLRQKTAEAVNWMTGRTASRQAPDQTQTACSGQHTLQRQHAQPVQHAHPALQCPQRSNSGQGSSMQQWQADAQRDVEQGTCDGDAAEVVCVGEEAASGASLRGEHKHRQKQAVYTVGQNAQVKPKQTALLPVSRTLKWRGSRTRSQRACHRAAREGCPSSFQRLLSR